MIEEVKESLLILHNTIHYITLIKSKETEIVNPPNIFPKIKKNEIESSPTKKQMR